MKRLTWPNTTLKTGKQITQKFLLHEYLIQLPCMRTPYYFTVRCIAMCMHTISISFVNYVSALSKHPINPSKIPIQFEQMLAETMFSCMSS